MSIEALQERDLFSPKFKYIGLGLSALCILYALVHHFIEASIVFEGLHAPKMIFVLGLMIAISSKEPSEDERVRQIRSYVHYILSGMFIGYIFFQELDGSLESMIRELASFLTVYLMIFHFIYYFGTDWIINNRGKFWFIIVVILIALLISFDILWAA